MKPKLSRKKNRYRHTEYSTLTVQSLDNVAAKIAVISPRMEILWLNRACHEEFSSIDISKKPVCYRSLPVSPKKKICNGCPIIKAFRTGKTQSLELDAYAKGRIYNIIGTPVRDVNKKIRYVVETIEDITERKKVEEARRDSEERYRALFDQAADSIVLIDVQSGALLEFNNTACERLGYTREEFKRLKISDFEVVEKPSDVRKHIRKIIKKGADCFETKHRTKNGEIRNILVSSKAVSIQGKNFVQSIWIDITDKKKAEEKLDALNKELIRSNRQLGHMALVDSHTGLYNHRYLMDIIETEYYRAKRYSQPLSVIMIDIDYFKSINDVYGHQFGDLVLKQLAVLLKRMVRRHDITVRFGGEEFIIIASGIDRAEALVLAQRIMDASNLYNFGDKKYVVRLKLSIAAASYPEDKAAKGIDLVEAADRILNKVKEHGGSRIYSALDIKKDTSSDFKKNRGVSNVKFLREKIEKLTKRANQSLIEAVFAFAKTIRLKDRHTGEHVERIVNFSTEIAKALNLPKDEIELIKQASVLHDLGKIGITDKILRKNSKLTKKEFEQIKKHPQIGVDIIRPIHFLHRVIPFILYHHERWDGKGYPMGLKGEAIPLGARIVAIADQYEALIANRPYRKACSDKMAMEFIKKGAGIQFDPKIVKIFLKVMKKKIGK
ncbi:MAG: diguanylate cyclase [Candidatus Omnitrophota bacterium]